jgi:hypothetical protein
MNEVVIVGLIILVLAQQGLNWWQTQILINKLMSRNYAEYEQSKPVEEEPDIPPPEIKRDLSYLNSLVRR